MIKRRRLEFATLIFCMILVIACADSGKSQGTKTQLAKTQYVDPKGYFKIIPLQGWRIQEYPQDPRGKVAFFGPGSNVDFRILLNAVDFDTFEDLVASCKKIGKRNGVKHRENNI